MSDNHPEPPSDGERRACSSCRQQTPVIGGSTRKVRIAKGTIVARFFCANCTAKREAAMAARAGQKP
jgi:RNase P subunit RPR2